MLRVSVDQELVVERGGLRWSLNPSDFPQSSLFWLGTYDPWDYSHALSLLSPGATIVDVGANFGFYSIKLASGLQRQCKVFAFEPNPPTLARLQKNVKLNALEGVISVHGLALSDGEGEATIATKPGNSGWARLTASNEGARARLITLDGFVKQQGIERIDFIKIDVEGFEAQVLRGASEVLHRYKPVVLIELNPEVARQQGSSVAWVVSLLEENGYRLYRARRQKLLPLGVVPENTFVNAFAFPPERTISST